MTTNQTATLKPSTKRRKAPSRATTPAPAGSPGGEAVGELERELWAIEKKELIEKLSKAQEQSRNMKEAYERIASAMENLEKDKLDIIEHKNKLIKDNEKERTAVLEANYQLRAEVDRVEVELRSTITKERSQAQTRIEELEDKVAELKKELDNLTGFRKEKIKLLDELEQTKKALSTERKEHNIAVGDLERKLVQEKDRLKKDMMAKIQQAKESLLKMTDSRLEATTKATMMENQQMSAELAYHSRSIRDMISTSEKLTAENTDLKRKLEASVVTEKEFAKRATATQKAIEKLLEKLSIQEEKHQDAIATLKADADKREAELEAEIEETLSRGAEWERHIDNANDVISNLTIQRGELEQELLDRTELLTATASILISAATDMTSVAGIPSRAAYAREARLRQLLPALRTYAEAGELLGSQARGTLRPIHEDPEDHSGSSTQPSEEQDKQRPSAVSGAGGFAGLGSPLPDSPPMPSPHMLSAVRAASIAVQTEPVALGPSVAVSLGSPGAGLHPLVLTPKANSPAGWGKRSEDLPMTKAGPALFLRRDGGTDRVKESHKRVQ